MPPHLLQEDARLEEENAGVPDESAALEIFARALFIRLFDEPRNSVDSTHILLRVANLDITILRVWAVRAHADRHQIAGFSRRDPLQHGLVKGAYVLDHMVGGHQQQDL